MLVILCIAFLILAPWLAWWSFLVFVYLVQFDLYAPVTLYQLGTLYFWYMVGYVIYAFARAILLKVCEKW